MLSKAAKAFIGRCYKDDVVYAITPIFDQIYEINGEKFKFTKEVFEEIKNTNEVKVLYMCEKSVNIMGVRANAKASVD